MKHCRPFPSFLLSVALFSMSFFSPETRSAGEPGKALSPRAWTVQDSIAVRYFVLNQDPYGPSILEEEGDSVLWSPGGNYFAFVYRHGDLATDSNIHELSIFSRDQVRTALRGSRQDPAQVLKPLRTIRMQSHRSDDRGAGIRDLRWESASSLVFLGIEGKDAIRQLYRVELPGGSLNRLTNVSSDVQMAWPTAFASGSFLFSTDGPTRAFEPLNRYPMTAIQGADLVQIIADERQMNGGLYASFRGQEVREVASTPFGVFGAWTSPSGEWAVALYESPGDSVPPEWKGYEYPPSERHEFMLIDLKSGQGKSMLNAPWGAVTKAGQSSSFVAMWSHDSRYVVLKNTTVPITPSQPDNSSEAFLVVYDVQTATWSVLEPLTTAEGEITHALWRSQKNEFVITRERSKSTQYHLEKGIWKAGAVTSGSRPQSPPAVASAGGLTVALRQSANEPPRMVASENGKTLWLTDEDPALRGIWRAEMREVSWVEAGNKTVRGGLLLPREFSAAKPVPLVIQAFNHRLNLFRPDGMMHAAYAAQALVAAGMAVLFVDIPAGENPRSPTAETPQEGPQFVARVDAAVTTLSAMGIDAKRVGLIGFSRGGYMTYYAITHPGKVKLAAAVVDDAHTASYGEYIQDAAFGMSTPTAYEQQYGKGTFWQNKAGWADAPGFNVDRVVTPALFSLGGRINKIVAVETIAAFRLMDRPFEFLYFPDKAHQAQRPREREALMDAAVDWMSFWLQDRIDDSPAKLERWKRWQDIRSRWEKRTGVGD
jgi:dipeptidyl aminopeptidase/acylaminoacyl peptidase